MVEIFSLQSRRAIEFSRDEAGRLKHDYIGTEHLLLGLIKLGESRAVQVLSNLGMVMDELRQSIEDVVQPAGGTEVKGQLPLTARAKRVLELSGQEAAALSSKEIETEHILLALVKDEEGVAAQILSMYDIEYDEVLAEVKNILTGKPSTFVKPASKIGPKTAEEIDRALEVLASRGRAFPFVSQKEGIRFRNCPIIMSDGKPCGKSIWDGVNQVCVFHSPQAESKSGAFDEEFARKINEITFSSKKQTYDFTRYVFPSASFRSKVFKKPVYFSWCEFAGESDFTWAIFEGEVDFSGAKFKKNVIFYGTQFKKKAVFFGASFSADAHFAATSQNKSFVDEADFRYLVLSKDSTITFDKLELTRCRFTGTNLEKIGFLDVEWCRLNSNGKGFRLRKRVIWDEIAPLTQEDTGRRNYERIMDNYHQLVLNYERKRDFETAECFHVGEMELKRLAPKKSRFSTFLHRYLSLTALYKYVSNYGENYILPFAWLIVGMLLFSFLFMYAGLKPTDGFPQYAAFNYDLDLSIVPNISEIWDDWISSFTYTLQVFSLQRESIFTPEHRGGHLLKIVAYVFSPTIIAFFLLALRRRFKR